MKPVPALTIRQPLASLVALGEKKIETRPWTTRYRGELLVHAGKGAHLLPGWGVLPLGAIIARVFLVDVIPVEQLLDTLSADERSLGDYTPGRFGWILDDPEPIEPPVPCKGQLGLWTPPAVPPRVQGALTL